MDGNGNNEVALARYNEADGSLDTSFGTGGIVTTNLGALWEGTAAVSVESDGSILVAGQYRGHFGLLHYSSSGVRNTGFGGATNGIVRTSFGGSGETPTAMTIDGNGCILVAGTTTQAYGTQEFALVRYNASGTVDTTFGTNGTVHTFISGGGDIPAAITIQPNDGKILLAGQATPDGSSTDFALVRYNTDGSLDASFGDKGKVTTSFGDGADEATGVAVQANGQIVVSGVSQLDGNGDNTGEDHFALARYNPDGSLDTTFGPLGNGTVTTDFSILGFQSEDSVGMILDTNGRVIVAGTALSNDSSYSSFAIACYDPGMSSLGVQVTDVAPGLRVVGDQTASTGQTLDLSNMALFGHAPTTGDFTYQIDWGDGSTPDAGQATITDPGDSSDPLVGSFGGRHVYALAGNYYVAATITDPAGGSTTQIFEVTVNDAPPADTGDSDDSGDSGFGDVSQSQTSVTDTTPPSSPPLDLSLSDLPLPAPIAPITSVVSTTSGSGGVTLSGTSTTVSLTSTITGSIPGASEGGGQSLSGVLSTVSLSTSSSTSSVASQTAGSATDATTASDPGSAVSTVSDLSSQSASVTTNDPSQSFQSLTSRVNTTNSSDPALLAAVRQALAMPAGAAVMSTDWARLTTLTADSNQVYSLASLQYAVNLQSLTLVPSDFSKPGHLTNLSLLSGLTNLKSLTLQDCGLNDTSLATIPANLTGLQTLDLRYNNINTVPAVVANQTSLTSLLLYGNPLAGNGAQTWYQAISGKLLTVDIAPQNTDQIIASIDPTNPTATYKALAGAFYNLPIAIYQYLVNNIQYQAYSGAMKGPLAVLETKAGNDWDTDSLLAALLQQTGMTTQYASAQVLVDIPTVMKWLAVRTPAAAYDALDQAGLVPSFCQIQNGNAVSATLSQATYIAFNHAWLQATVTPPGATSPQTVYLDPTWKFKDLQAGIPNILTAVPFNTTGTGGYLESVQDESAAAFYENEVRTYLAQNDPSQTIADVPYDGPIAPQTISALPVQLSYSYLVTGFSVSSTIPASLTDQVQIGVDIPQASLGVTVSSGQNSSTITVNPAVFTPSMVGDPVVVDTSSGGATAYTITSYTSSTVVVVQGSVSWAGGDTLAIPGFSSLQNIPNISLERITVGYDTSDPLKPRLYINGVDTADSALDGSATGNVNLVVQMAWSNYTPPSREARASTWPLGWTPRRCRTNCWSRRGRWSTTPTSPRPTAPPTPTTR